MTQKKIVITGIGVVAPNGIGKDEFWKNCRAGISGVKPVTLFDTSRYSCHVAGELSDFQPERYLGPKGLRNLDRTTLLALVAARLAIDDSKLEITEENTHDIGVVLGSTMGSVHSISTFDIESLREGPRYVNPACFPNTVINSPASQISIRFGIKGLNATIGTGFTASLDALEYAVDMLQFGRVKTVLVGGVEELCVETFGGFHELGLLSSRTNGSHRTDAAPVKTSDVPSIALGEGSGILVLESEGSAKSRKARCYGEVASVVSVFQGDSAAHFKITDTGALSVMHEALKSANVHQEEIDAVYPWGGDEVVRIWGQAGERRALTDLFGNRLDRIQRRSLRTLAGECFSAMGALELVAAVGDLAQGTARTILVNNFSRTGSYTSAILQANSTACGIPG